jgi:predicted MarR family transcription regulator
MARSTASNRKNPSARTPVHGRAVRREELKATWHLAHTPQEVLVTEFEFALLRIAATFERWQLECFGAVADRRLGPTCNVILHVVRLKERPKTQSEIARLLNRDDIANVQYSIRKLQQAGLIERAPGGRRKSVAYRATARGRRACEAYSSLRAKVLMSRVQTLEHWEERVASAQQSLDTLRAVYEQAALVLATHRAVNGGSTEV